MQITFNITTAKAKIVRDELGIETEADFNQYVNQKLRKDIIISRRKTAYSDLEAQELAVGGSDMDVPTDIVT